MVFSKNSLTIKKVNEFENVIFYTIVYDDTILDLKMKDFSSYGVIFITNIMLCVKVYKF